MKQKTNKKTQKTLTILFILSTFILILNISNVFAVYTPTPLSQLQWEIMPTVIDGQIVVNNGSTKIAIYNDAPIGTLLNLNDGGQIGYDYGLKITYMLNITGNIGVTNPDEILVMVNGQPSGAGLHLTNSTPAIINASITCDSGTTSSGNINLERMVIYRVEQIYCFNTTELKRYVNITIFQSDSVIGSIEATKIMSTSYIVNNYIYLYMGSASGLCETIFDTNIYQNKYLMWHSPASELSFTQDWTTPQPLNYSSFYWNITDKTYPVIGLYQETNYTMLNHVWNNTVPYVNGNYAVYYSPISNGSLGANIYDVLWNSYNGTMNLNKTGTVGNGYFYHYVKPELYEGRYTYQLMRINGTIIGTSETFSQDIIIQAFVPSMSTTLYLTGGRYINPFTMLKLSYNYLSQATYYNIKGYVTINSILGNGTGNYTLSTSYLSSNPINYAEFIGIGQTTNFSIFQVTQGNVLNGQFQFTLAPRTFSQTKVYQILVVNVTLDSGFNTIDYYSLEFDSYLSTPNTSSIDNNFAEGAGTFWLILMLVLFVPVMGVTMYVAMITKSGSATALVFFGGTLLDIIFGVTTGLLDWWVIVIVGIFLVISAYAQWGKVTSGG